jgi:hypothetical protein
VTIGTVDRRTFIVTAAGLLAAPLATDAQPTGKVYRMGYLQRLSHQFPACP